MQEHVQSGDKLNIEAKTFNCMLDAAEFVERISHGIKRPPATSQSSPLTILVKNSTGVDVGRFGIMTPTAPVFEPVDAASLLSFQNEIVLDCDKPTSSDSDNFVVANEPIGNDGIGHAFITGVCIVKIDVQDEDAKTCGAYTDDVAKLRSGMGSNQIIWKESGTGTKWAIIRIGSGGDIKIATLLGTLSYRGTATATVTKGGSGTVTAHDVLLKSGESLDSGTTVVLALIDGDECVIDASCG